MQSRAKTALLQYCRIGDSIPIFEELFHSKNPTKYDVLSVKMIFLCSVTCGYECLYLTLFIFSRLGGFYCTLNTGYITGLSCSTFPDGNLSVVCRNAVCVVVVVITFYLLENHRVTLIKFRKGRPMAKNFSSHQGECFE